MLWSYCIILSLDDKIKCLELSLKDSAESANRNLAMHLTLFEGSTIINRSVAEVENLLHRTWVNFCLTTSTIHDEMKFYYNGKLIGESTGYFEQNATILQDSSEIVDSFLIFGQVLFIKNKKVNYFDTKK